MRGLVRYLLLALALVVAQAGLASPLSAKVLDNVVVLTLQAPINPVAAQYIDRGLKAAEGEGALAVVLQLDTPGGLDSSMRSITQGILNASVPVFVYVAPAGARAASAGTFITVAGHVAAMAPNTVIGAAHPISGQGEDIPGTLGEKVENDAAAYIRTLATQRGRNADWAERAVRESVSATEQEALSLGVIDVVANDVPDLLRQVDGRQVSVQGQPVTLHTRDASLSMDEMNGFERFVGAISDPNLAYILMTIAMLAIYLELLNPGAILPGIVGVIALLLGLFGLGNLPFNYTGLLLIGFAFVLFTAELFLTSHGLLAAGGVISLALGSVMLMAGNPVYFQVSPWVIATIVGSFATFFIWVVAVVIRDRLRRPPSMQESLVGRIGVVRSELNPEGTVLVSGDLWSARTDQPPIPIGRDVRIRGVEGFWLWVVPIEQALRQPASLPEGGRGSLPAPQDDPATADTASS
jgi:membrane-bound serine protease (ClpP class)